MRIAFITHEPFYPPSGGGSAEAVYLVQEMVRRGNEVHVFCPRVREPDAVRAQFKIRLHEFTTWEMGRYTSLRNFKYLAYPFFLQRMVEKANRETPYDLILSQHAIAAVAAGRLKSSLRIPVVMNFLDYLTAFMEAWPPYLAPPPLLNILKQFELALPRKHAVDGVLTVSDTLADYIAGEGYPKEKILPIYYGYDAELFPFQPIPAAPNPPTVVMHGSLDHHHLRDIALDAMEMVVRKKPDVVFKFVGHRTGALDAFLRRAETRLPQARIVGTGFVPYKEVAGHLANASIGMVPYEESTGTHCAFVAKVVEYLAVGLPVVCTPLKSVMRYFNDEPMVRFSGFDGASFGREILNWLDEPVETRRRLAPAASERVRRELDWRTISKKAIDFVGRIGETRGK